MKAKSFKEALDLINPVAIIPNRAKNEDDTLAQEKLEMAKRRLSRIPKEQLDKIRKRMG